MKTKVPEKIKKFVIEHLQNYCWHIGFSHYRSNILYMEKDEKHKDGAILFATADVDKRYLRAVFKIFPPFIEKYDEGELELCKEILAHECAHIATQHMCDLVYAVSKDEGEIKDAWESLTEVVGRMAYNLNKKS